MPVVAGKVEQKDMPIYLDGLGTVQAFNTVTVHTRVDGQLQQVLFSEGQNVKAGDLIAVYRSSESSCLLVSSKRTRS